MSARTTAPRLPRVAGALAWLAVCVTLGCIQLIVTRACGYENGPLVAYAFYFALHVYLPGVVALALVQRAPVSLATSIALGIPTGYAVEIFSFLLFAALHAKGALPFLPIAWVGAAAWSWRRMRGGLLRLGWTRSHVGLALALALLFLGTALATAGNLFAESPLVGALPQRPIFHDWVYLVSRAAAVKNLWPLEDPSLAGAPLQYHYFMLVHVASASWVTGVEVTTVLLRLALVPLGFVLVMQAFLLGRRVSRQAWGGVLAAVLTLAAGELAWIEGANRSVFLGRFVRWLYVSPTFYFGIIFFGALLLALHRWQAMWRLSWRDMLWLAALATAAAGAKGTVLPVLIPALGLWALAAWWRTRKFPTRIVAAAMCVGGMFAVVYAVAMSSWGTAALAWAPFDVYRIAEFWQKHHAAWTTVLAGWLPAGVAAGVAGVACAAVVFAGTEGVRLLALPYMLGARGTAPRPLVSLLGATLLSSLAMGSFLQLDADGELYLFLMTPLPAAVLASGFLMDAARAVAPRRTGVASTASAPRVGLRWPGLPVMAILGALASIALLTQTTVMAMRTRRGVREWMRALPDSKPDASMLRLHEALRWIREHTEPDAVLVANAWTPASREKDRWDSLDHTLAGVHYYYSALAERRMLVEGPNYLLNGPKVRQHLELAAKLFLDQESDAAASVIPGSPCYALLDRSAKDAPMPARAPGLRVFANERIEIYRLPRAHVVSPARAAKTISNR